MSAPCLHKPARDDDPEVTATERFASKLSFVLASGRFVHYLKCFWRDLVWSGTHLDEIARVLDSWVKDYVDDNPETSSESVKAQRPLASAELSELVLRNVDLSSGNYECRFFMRPHYQFEAPPISVKLEVLLPTPIR
jgi:type VI secretion system protein ImpC